ncbi:MAG: hypothetical protein PHE58_06875, partial [Candidatus Omnitrophica bacterium]|nr:hypothetical protein [Candidatus Omnitrophota bacterium]
SSSSARDTKLTAMSAGSYTQATVDNPLLGNEIDGFNKQHPNEILPSGLPVVISSDTKISPTQVNRDDIPVKGGFVARSGAWLNLAETSERVELLVRADKVESKSPVSMSSLSSPTFRTIAWVRPSCSGIDVSEPLNLQADNNDKFAYRGNVQIATATGTVTLNDVVVRDQGVLPSLREVAAVTGSDTLNKAAVEAQDALGIKTVRFPAAFVEDIVRTYTPQWDVSKEDIFIKVTQQDATPALVRYSDISLEPGESRSAVKNGNTQLYVPSDKIINEESAFYDEYGFPPLSLIGNSKLSNTQVDQIILHFGN